MKTNTRRFAKRQLTWFRREERISWIMADECLDKNNIFGLWNSKKHEYFYYTTWKESIGGYKRGIQYKYFVKEYKDYYHFLSEIGYATDPQYIIKLKKLVKKTEYVWSN